ncbi:MAG TPA: hypothetical protein VFV00_13520 [Acidimicrobiales bacterium]|nr:hypothetical protein [Acidimicrobiales bacterium]
MKATTGFRRTKFTAIAGVGAFVLTFFAFGPTASGQAGDLQPGRGLAIAETQKVDPRTGSLSLGITMGRSIAGHQNTVAQASSQAVDLGIIGTTAAAQACDGSDPTLPADKQPQPIQVDSRQPNAHQESDQDQLSGVPIPSRREATATPAPFGEAITTTGPMDIAGLIHIGQGVSYTSSGLVDGGKTREAKATVDIDGITFPGGISLAGLHWEATWSSADQTPGKGTFTIGSATAGGQSLPTNDPTAALNGINAALKPLGYAIKPPTASNRGGIQYVDPLSVEVFPSPTRDAVANGLFGGIQPIREDIFKALLDQSCKNSTYITIFDIAVASMTGGGSFSLIFGGVQASSGDALNNQYCLGCGGNSSPILGTSNSSKVLSSSGSTLGTNKAAGSPSTPSSSNGGGGGGAPAATAAVTPAASTKGKGARGGALAGVGLASLALLGLMAEGDRRKMRRAQREIPQFEE